MVKYIPSRPMREHTCVLCGRPGGKAITSMQLALQLGVSTQRDSTNYAHSSCVATRKRKLGLTTSTMKHVPVAQRPQIIEDERAD